MTATRKKRPSATACRTRPIAPKLEGPSMRANRPPPIQRGNSCLVGKVPRWIAEIMVAGSIPTALTSEEQRTKTLCYEIAKRHEGHEKKAAPARPSKTVRVFEIDSGRERPLECPA